MRMTRLLLVMLLATWPANVFAEAPAFDVMVEGAVDFELQPLLNALENKHEERIGAWTYWTGRVGTHSVVVARTEMGPLNASASTALGIARFHPKRVINQGTAGAHTADLHVFDIVLGESAIDYGAVRSAHADAGAGIHVTDWKIMETELRKQPDHPTSFAFFKGDPALLAIARKTPYEHGRLVTGRVGSAYQFNRELDYINWVHATFKTDSEDMESAFAAGVAEGMGTPFLAVRIVSDSEFNHPKLERVAGDYCAGYVLRLIRSME